jgi:hypothetical protein
MQCLQLMQACGAVEYLQRDVALQPRVARPIHFPHAPGTDGREDLVRAEVRGSLRRTSARAHQVHAPPVLQSGRRSSAIRPASVSARFSSCGFASEGRVLEFLDGECPA